MLKKKISIFTFILFLIASIIYLNRVFSTKNYFENTFSAFKKLSQKTNIDIIFYGSSHSFNTYNPLIINKHTKAISFNMASGSQSLPFTELLIEQNTKKNNPKLIIIEMYPFSIERPTTKDVKGYQLRVLDKISNLSFGKFKKITEYYHPKEYLSVYSPLARNHNKWNKNKYFSLSRNEAINTSYMFFNNGFMGIEATLKAEDKEKYKTFSTKKIEPIERKIIIDSDKKINIVQAIQTAKKNAENVLIVTSPDLRAKFEWDFSFYDNLEAICKEQGVPYLNLNNFYNDIGLVVEDFKDPSHLNVRGAHKTSIYLSKYINNNYQLPDRSKEEVWKQINSTFPSYYKQYIKLNTTTINLVDKERFTDGLKIDSLTITKKGNIFKITPYFKKTNTYSEEIEKYNLSFKIFPKKEEEHLVAQKNKDKGWYFDKRDIFLGDISKKKFFNVKSNLKEMESIKLFIYKKEGYDGVVGNEVTINNISFKD